MLKVSCIYSGSPKSVEAYQLLSSKYEFVDVEDSDVILALGGDGFLLETAHQHLKSDRRIYGMNRGTLGFLLNNFHEEDLFKKLDNNKIFFAGAPLVNGFKNSRTEMQRN